MSASQTCQKAGQTTCMGAGGQASRSPGLRAPPGIRGQQGRVGTNGPRAAQALKGAGIPQRLVIGENKAAGSGGLGGQKGSGR